MKRAIPLFLVIISLFIILLGCPSTPKVPEATPTLEPTPEPTEDVNIKAPSTVATPAPKAVADEEIQEAQTAIARAEEIKAATHAADDLKAAKTALEEALKIKDSDPEGARSSLATAKEKAASAYDKAAEKVAANFGSQLKIYKEKLMEIEADKYRTTSYNKLVENGTAVNTLFTEKKIVDGMTQGETVLQGMAELYASLDEKIKWVRVLKKNVETNLAQAETLEAYVWTPEKLENINNHYYAGLKAIKNYKIDEAEESLGTAKELSIDMLNAAVKIKKEKETEKIKNEALNLLEEASKLMIETDDGRIIEANPINIDEFLKSIDEESTNKVTEPEARLKWQSAVAVLGEITEDNLLIQAKELIKKGVLAEKAGKLEEAQEYYAQARNYLKLYKAQSISKIYTVRLIPERRDCLWRIAEYDYIYDNPYLWPLIWRRNRKQIQNPNLIHPGWQLIIPER